MTILAVAAIVPVRASICFGVECLADKKKGSDYFFPGRTCFQTGEMFFANDTRWQSWVTARFVNLRYIIFNVWSLVIEPPKHGKLIVIDLATVGRVNGGRDIDSCEVDYTLSIEEKHP